MQFSNGNGRNGTIPITNKAHCDTLIRCALEIFLLTYLLTLWELYGNGNKSQNLEWEEKE